MDNLLGPFSELAKTSVRYAAPFLILGMLAFALGAFLIAAAFSGELQILVGAVGAFSALLAMAAAAYVVFLKPELMRSDEHTQIVTVTKWVEDPQVDDRMVRNAERILSQIAGRKAPKVIEHEEGAEDDGP